MSKAEVKEKPVKKGYVHDSYDNPEKPWKPSQAYLDSVRPDHVKKAIAAAASRRTK